jgi:hypothetical protein
MITSYYHAPNISDGSDAMRGPGDPTNNFFSYVSPEQRVRADHPLCAIRAMTDRVFAELSPRFTKMYSDIEGRRRIKVNVTRPDQPDDPSELVGDGDRGFVMAAACRNVDSPLLKTRHLILAPFVPCAAPSVRRTARRVSAGSGDRRPPVC